MRGAKLDGKRVRLLVGAMTRGGTRFEPGDVGTFKKVGVVACMFTRDDCQQLAVGHMSPSDFQVIETPEDE